MTYCLAKSEEPSRLRLVSRSAARRGVGALLFLIGAGLLAVAILSPAAPARPLAGLGVAFLSAGMLVVLHRIPEELVFDNRTALFLVKESSSESDDRAARLPYDQILGFEVHRYVEQSSRSRHVSFRVILRKKDGARWVLASQQNEQSAQAFCDELRRLVQLHKRAEERVEPLPSGVFLVDVGPVVTTISWKKRVDFPSTIGTIGILSGVLTAGLSLPVVGAVLVGLFAGSFLLLVGYHTIRTAGKLVTIRLDSDSICVHEQGGFFPRNTTIPVQEVHGVLFHFDPSVVDRCLIFLNESQMQSMLSDDLSGGLIALIQQARNMRTVDVGGLTVVEKLELEQILQREIFRRSGKAMA